MKIFYSLLFICGITNLVNAQTPYVINQNTVKCCGGDGNGMGTSFLTLAAGNLDSIKIITRSASFSTDSITIYQGNTLSIANRIYTQVLSGIPVSIVNAPYTVALSSPLTLTSNSVYTFLIHRTPIRFGNSNTYVDGSLWVRQGFLTAGEHTDKDLDFVAYIGNLLTTDLSNTNKNEISYLIDNGVLTFKNFDAEQITLLDLSGKEIISTLENKLQLSNNLAKGIYILHAKKGNIVYTDKVYIN